MLHDSRKLLLNNLWHLGARDFQDSDQAEQDASDLKLKLEVGHELEPVAEGKDCLLILLDEPQGSDMVVVQC